MAEVEFAYADRSDADPAILMQKSLARIEAEIRSNDETIKTAMVKSGSPQEYRSMLGGADTRNQALFEERDRLRSHLRSMGVN